MARGFGKKTQQENENENESDQGFALEATPEAEAVEVSDASDTPDVTESVETPAGNFYVEEDDADLSNFFNMGVADASNSSAENSADQEASEEESSEMSETEVKTPEVQEVQNGANGDASKDENSLLSDAAKQVMENATSKAVEMLTIDSIPPTLIHISTNLRGLDALGNMIVQKTREFEVGTSDKDGKVKAAIENLTDDGGKTEDGKLTPYGKREKAVALKKQIEELEAQFDDLETELYDEVEKALVAAGDDVWSDEKIQVERDAIREMHASYAGIYKNTAQIIESHRKVKPGDNLGTIEQYVPKVDKPFGRSSSSSSGAVNSSATGSRNIFVNEASYSLDGGTTWVKATNPKGGSNVAALAAELAKTSKESANDLKDKIYTEYYADSGLTFETATNEGMPEVATFDFVRLNKASGQYETIKLRLKKRIFSTKSE